jgi:hypothetical protein
VIDTSEAEYPMTMLPMHPTKIFSPKQFEYHPIRAVVGFYRVFIAIHSVRDLAWAQTAIGEPQRKL